MHAPARAPRPAKAASDFFSIVYLPKGCCGWPLVRASPRPCQLPAKVGPLVVVKNGRSLTTPPPRLMSPEKPSGRRAMDAATVDRSKITQLLADFVVRSAP